MDFTEAREAWLEHGYVVLPEYLSSQDLKLALFGFPPPGHPYWTPTTLTGMTQRYPGLDLAPWQPPAE